MRAAGFVGRVGGLALALGVGSIAYCGAAWADDGTETSPAVRGASASQTAAGPGTANRGTGRAVQRGSAQTVAPVPLRAAAAGTAARAAATVTVGARTVPAPVTPAPVTPTPVTPAAVTPAAVTSAPGGVPQPAPVDSAAAVARRESLFGGDSIVTNPDVVWNEGVLSGTLAATSTSGLRLSYVMVSGPSQGGKLGSGPLLPLTNFTRGGGFTYVPYVSVLTDPGQTETFRIMALENSPFVEAVEGLLGPLGELLVPQALALIHRIPIVGTLLSPLIGSATVVTFTVNPSELAAGRPTAFTYKMPSFDGTLISLNYFPSINVANGEVDSAPTVFAASGLACAANTDPSTVFGQLFPAQQFGSLTPGIKPLRTGSFAEPGSPLSYAGAGGYNVVTWDPRGEFASGGQLQIDNPFFEGRDVSAMIDWLTAAANPARAQIKTDLSGDPLLGMTGGSYGGGIQLTTIDPRIEALIPEIAWNSLLGSLYPNANQFKTGWGAILPAALFFTGARVNPAIYLGILTGVLVGWLSDSSQAVLGSVGPTVLLEQEQAATLLFQGIHDGLFPLQQATANAQTISENPYGPPVKMGWFCGGHGTCLTPSDPLQDDRGLVDNLKWLDTYVAGAADRPADTIPTFQWYDQRGQYWTSDLLPFQDGFNRADPYRAAGSGGVLGLGPLIGGSGPYPLNDLPFSIVNAGPALNALNVAAAPPVGSQIVGEPTLSFSYRGLGTSRTVYAQLVDNTSRLVLSNIVTPIPVILDGRERTVTIPLESVVYTVAPGDSLTLQITSSAVNYENFTTLGVIGIGDIELDLPLRLV